MQNVSLSLSDIGLNMFNLPKTADTALNVEMEQPKVFFVT
jgi:hypothetical protein